MAGGFQIVLSDVGKKYNRNWLFRDLNHSFQPQQKIALIGKNGSGKSTLLRILAGQTSPSRGNINYLLNDRPVPTTEVYKHLSWMGPYIEVFPELTLKELFQLHFRFKSPLLSGFEEMIQLLNLKQDENKMLRYYSSGMLQRAKIGLALFTDSQVLMLDEPTSNMDKSNAELMLGLIDQYVGNRIYILASNMEREFAGFSDQLRLGKS